MNIREVILKAADSVKRQPNLFNFNAVVPKPECGTPGCALGWIAFHGGMVGQTVGTRTYWDFGKIGAALGLGTWPDQRFYERMTEIDDGWIDSAKKCSAALRAYADKYHPAEKPKGIPDSVRAIFETKQTETVL